MSDSLRGRRDPQARRNAIVFATAELIVEVGVDQVTHRMIAARADVPLGATTQYFDTLDELREAALQLLIEHVEQQIQQFRDLVSTDGASAGILSAFLSEQLLNAPEVRAERAVVTAAVHDPKLREIARTLSLDLISVLEPVHGNDRATAAAVFIDGVLWHSQINDAPLPRPIIEQALAGILGEDRSKP
jgi:DNA-binding transcriptional regulator YbjK